MTREELLAVIRSCAAVFRKYETLHLAKDTEDGRTKAAANADMAQKCEDSIARTLRDRLEAEGGTERNIAEELMDIGQHSGCQPSAEAQQCGGDDAAKAEWDKMMESAEIDPPILGSKFISAMPIKPEPARVTELASMLYEFEPIAEEDEGQVYTFSELASEMPNVHAVYLRRATSIIARFGNRLGEG